MATVHFVGSYDAREGTNSAECITLTGKFYEITLQKLAKSGIRCEFLLGRGGQKKFDSCYAENVIRPGDVLVVINPPHGKNNSALGFRNKVKDVSMAIGQKRVIYFDEYEGGPDSPYLKYCIKAECEICPNTHPNGVIIECVKETQPMFSVPRDALELADLAIEIFEKDKLKSARREMIEA